jgi:primary-amine oxidase
MAPHPFQILDVHETRTARDVVLALHKDVVVEFREIYLQEPDKQAMKQYLALEHSPTPGRSPASKRPPRLAKCQYDVIGSNKIPESHESVVDIGLKKRVKHLVVGRQHQASLTLWEFDRLVRMHTRKKCFRLCR